MDRTPERSRTTWLVCIALILQSIIYIWFFWNIETWGFNSSPYRAIHPINLALQRILFSAPQCYLLIILVIKLGFDRKRDAFVNSVIYTMSLGSAYTVLLWHAVEYG